MRYAIIFAAVLMLGGCANLETPLDDGYQFGDMTATVTEAQAQYCAESDPRERAVRLAVLRATGVPVPVSGACTDVLEIVPEVPEVDVEQAERDRARFQ